MLHWISTFVLYSLLFFADVYGNVEVIDLTHDVVNGTVYWPSIGKATFWTNDIGSAGDFRKYSFTTPVHGGTHIDAPSFFHPSKFNVDEVPLDRLVGKAFIIDVSKEVQNDTDLFITVDHLIAAEKLHGMTMDDKILIFYTGFSHFWPNRKKYLGTDTANFRLFRFPGLHSSTGKWIVENRRIKSIGIDTSSIDHGRSQNFLNHQYLFAHNIPIFKNLNLKDIEKIRGRDDVMVHALPMKIKRASGAPLRIIATYNGLSIKTSVNGMLDTIMLCIVFVNQYGSW